MKRILLALLFVSSCSVAMAQENGNRDAENRIVRGPYETNRFFDNIFIGVAGGVNIYRGENDSYGSLGKRLAPALDINIGKWITPSVGLRLGYSGIQAKGWTNNGVYAKGEAGEGMFKEKFSVSFLHGDFLWNFSNAVSGYKETRTWNFIPFVGAGWARSYGNDYHDNELAVVAGLLNNIRLGKVVDLTLEARYMIVNERFDGVVRASKAEGMFSTTIGVTFKLNRRGFNRAAAPVDTAPYLTLIQSLKSDNSVLDSQNAALKAENEKLRNKPAEVVVKTEKSVILTPAALFFRIGVAKLDSNQLEMLDFYVKNALNIDKNITFTLVGSADKATGSAAINKRLSQQRAEFVYNLLVNKYGISSDRLIKQAEGDTNNRFNAPELNRAVIIFQ